jgi:hypothetical protein
MKLYRKAIFPVPAALALRVALTLSAVWALSASCIEDGTAGEEGGQGRFGAGEGNYVAFAIDLSYANGIETRAVSEDPGTDNERMVEEIRIVFYDPETEKAVDVWDIKAKNVSDGGLSNFDGEDVSDVVEPTKDAFVAKARYVEDAAYKILAIVNPTDAAKALTEEGNTLDEVRQAEHSSDDVVADFTGGTDEGGTPLHNRFLMLNYQGELGVSNKRDFYETPEQAERYPVAVKVERAVAKISVTTDQPFLPPIKAFTSTFPKPLLNLTWGVSVVNRHSYLMRHAAAKLDGSEERTGDTDRANFYAADPNFEDYAGMDADELGAQFRYAADADLNREVRFYSEGAYFDQKGNPEESADYVYVPENTMAVGDQRSNLVTHVVFRAQFGEPWRLPLPTRSSYEPQPEHFFILYITGTDLAVIIPGEDAARYIDSGSFGDGPYDGYLDKEEHPYFYEIRFALDAAAKKYGITGNMDEWDSIEPFTMEFPHRLCKFVFYKDGVGYYNVPVRHFDRAGQGNYGVARNNIYNIRIKDIRWPDSNVPPGPEYDLPLGEPQEPAMTGMDVVITSWDWAHDDANANFTSPGNTFSVVEVGTQSSSGVPEAGKAGTATFAVTTRRVAAGTHDATVNGLPEGVTVGNGGKITIDADGRGTLTLDVGAEAAAGTTPGLRLTVGGVQQSGTFALTVVGSNEIGYKPIEGEEGW